MLFWPATLTHAKRQLNNQFVFLNALRRGFGVAAIGRVRQQEPACGGIGSAMIEKKLGRSAANARYRKTQIHQKNYVKCCNANASQKAI
jgi:hypothetical protein